MPRNGGGGYNLPPGINPVQTQTLITTNWANTTLNDVAAAIAQSIAKDGQTIPTANLPMGGFKHTNVADPTARNEYATLGFVQDGRHMRLINVVGVNVIKADLPGGGITPAVGQLAQLIPVGTNSVALVSLSINGGSTFSVVTSAGNPPGAGTLQPGKPYLLSFDGSNWIIISAPDAANFAQSAMSGWKRPSTGTFPDITIVGPNTVHVPFGLGRIIAPGTTDISGVKDIQWAAQDVILTNVATAWATTLAVNASGQIVQFVGNVQAAWARNHVILGVVGHVNGTVTNVVTRPTIYGDMIYAAYDLATLFHNLLVAGGKMQPNGVNPLHLDIEAGSVWLLGSNPDSTDSPNIYNFPTFLDVDFYPITGNNSVGAITSAVPVTTYDLNGNGIPAAIPGGATVAVIHRLYILANQFLFLYGQRAYPDLATALTNIQPDDSALVTPTKLVDATFIGYIVAQKNTTGFNDQATSRLVTPGNATFSIGSAGSIGDAPIDGSIYGRINAAWAKVVDSVQAGSNVSVNAADPNKPIVAVPSGNLVAGVGVNLSASGANRLLGAGNLTLTGTETFRNKVINGRFDFWQRGTVLGPITGFGYLADMFSNEGTISTRTITRQAFALGQIDVPGNPTYFHRVVVASAAGGSTLLSHYVEDVTQFSGQTVTLSWWAKADANKQMSVEFSQRFGAGGSAQVIALGVLKVNLTANWQKFTQTFAVPTVAGKVLGTTPSALKITFWYDAAPGDAARTDSLPQQSGTFDLAMMQLEMGAIATAFEQRPLGVELALCQRYFEKSYDLDVLPGTAGGLGANGRSEMSILGITVTQIVANTNYKVTKAKIPTVTIFSPISGAAGFVAVSDNTDVACTVPFTGQGGFNISWVLGTKTGGKWCWTAEAQTPGT